MESYEINIDLKEKAKKLDKFILSKKKNNVDDTILKVFIIEHELLKHECKKCKQEPYWLKKPLPLILDRLNNNITDNRIENLRFLCPNCFSQIKKRKILFNKIVKDKQRECIDCKKRIKNSKTKILNIKCQKLRCKECLQKSLMCDELS